MVHGYHVIFGAYGFWLPNDPRGSWSDFVGSWELLKFGAATRSVERKTLTDKELKQRSDAKRVLKYPPVQYSDIQRSTIADGFRTAAEKSRFLIWACSILSEHVHMVIARHRFDIEQIVNLMKGEATKSLQKSGQHPHKDYKTRNGHTPSPWAVSKWKEFLESEASIENAIHYVEQNPEREGKPAQTWGFVTRFSGIDPGWITYY